MTNEEAINRLNDMLNEIYTYCNESKHMSEDSRQDMETFDLAIKALKKEPCGDCVSRQAVIGLFYRFLPQYTDDNMAFFEHFLDLPSVKPKTNTLDKIRAEIAEEKDCAYEDFERYKVEYLRQDWEDVCDSLPQDDFRYGMERAIEIINKYRK